MVSLQDKLNKLQTLEEDLENVSIQEITPKQRTIKRSPSSQLFQQQLQQQGGPTGLGLTVPPRRPSDNVLKRHSSSSKVSILERPVSNDSITSTTIYSEYSEDVNNSRNSSMTSGSIVSSPITKNSNFSITSIEQHPYQHQFPPHPSHHLRHTVSAPKLFPSYQSNRPRSLPNSNLSSSQLTNVSSTSLSTLKLTPSQKLRLKRQNSKSSSKSTIISDREKYYDLNSDEEDDTIEDGLIWNVPYTRGTAKIFSPVSGTNPHLIKNIMDQSPVMMPMSPLPGTHSTPVSPLVGKTQGQDGGFYKLADEAQSISQFYQISSETYVKQELLNRKKSSLNLPVMVKEASTLGLDDMNLVSEEKAKSLTSTRPIWLPPKSSKECIKHEKDIGKMFEKAAKLDKLKQEQHELELKLQEKNRVRLVELVKRGVDRNSTQTEIKKLSLKTQIPDRLRYEVWTGFLNKSKTSTSLEIETFSDLRTKYESLPSGLPTSKIQELKELIKEVYPSLGKLPNEEELNTKLLNLLKLAIISKISIVPHFDEFLLGLLLLKFNETDSFNLFYSIKVIILNDTLMKKFDSNLSKNSVMIHQLKSKEFKPDLENLSSSTILKILSSFSNLDIVFQLFDILMMNPNYKVLYCLVLTVLKDYHFGFNDLNELISDKNKNIKINVNDQVQFFEKFNHYYKKFF